MGDLLTGAMRQNIYSSILDAQLQIESVGKRDCDLKGGINELNTKIAGISKQISEVNTPIDINVLYQELTKIDQTLQQLDSKADEQFGSGRTGQRSHRAIHEGEICVAKALEILGSQIDSSQLTAKESDLTAMVLEKKTIEAAASLAEEVNVSPSKPEARPHAPAADSSPSPVAASAAAATSGKAEVSASRWEGKSYEEVSRQYTIPLSTKPPTPPNNINKLDGDFIDEIGQNHGSRTDAFEKFVHAQFEKKEWDDDFGRPVGTGEFEDIYSDGQKEALRECFNKTEHVSWKEFNQELTNIAQYIDQAIPPGKDYIVVVKEGKSNKWVAELVGPRLKHLPFEVVETPGEINKILKENPSVRNVVFFDDAVYSGSQLSGYMQDTIENLQTQGKGDINETVHFNIAAPYMTTYSEERFAKLQESLLFKENDFKIDVAPHKTMQSAADQVDEKYHRALNEIYWPAFLPIESQDDKDNAAMTLIDFLENVRSSNECKDECNFMKSNYPKLEEVFVELEKRHQRRYGMDEKGMFAPDSDKEYTDAELDYFIEVTQSIQSSYKHAYVQGDKQVIKMLEASYGQLQEAFPAYFEANSDRGLHSRTLTVFDHKTADVLSVLPCYELGAHKKSGMPIIAVDEKGDIKQPERFLACGAAKAWYKLNQ